MLVKLKHGHNIKKERITNFRINFIVILNLSKKWNIFSEAIVSS